jgi:hypothetical protein
MTAHAYPSEPEDYRFPQGIFTRKAHADCGCGKDRTFSFYALIQDAIWKLSYGEPFTPDELVGSAYCRRCKTLVRVTARGLRLV